MGVSVGDARLVRHLAGRALRDFGEGVPGPLLALLLGYGLPVELLLALCWGDVDLRARTLRVGDFPLPLTVRFCGLFQRYRGDWSPPAVCAVFPDLSPKQARRWVREVLGDVDAQTLRELAWAGAPACIGAWEAGAIVAELRDRGGAPDLLGRVEREFTARMRHGWVVWHRRLLRL